MSHLVGYYKFNDNLNDSAPSPVNLTTIPSPQYSAAKLGNGFDFNSTNIQNQVLKTSTAGKYAFTNGTNDLPFSLSFWMNYRGGGGGSFRHIFGRNKYGGSDNSTNAEYRITIEKSGRLSVVKFSQGNASNSIAITTTATIATNTFLHIVITDDAAGNTLIYINGILQTTTISNNGSGFVRFGTTGASEGFGNSPGVADSRYWFNGILDDFAIFKGYALTQDDINYIYNSGNGKELK